VIAALVMLSIILTASVLFPDMDAQWIVGILIGGSILAVVVTVLTKLYELTEREPRRRIIASRQFDPDTWRMPPLNQLPPARLSVLSRIWMVVLRGYLAIAGGLVLFRIFQLATAGA
jgi:hypothetical protein